MRWCGLCALQERDVLVGALRREVTRWRQQSSVGADDPAAWRDAFTQVRTRDGTYTHTHTQQKLRTHNKHYVRTYTHTHTRTQCPKCGMAWLQGSASVRVCVRV